MCWSKKHVSRFWPYISLSEFCDKTKTDIANYYLTSLEDLKRPFYFVTFQNFRIINKILKKVKPNKMICLYFWGQKSTVLLYSLNQRKRYFLVKILYFPLQSILIQTQLFQISSLILPNVHYAQINSQLPYFSLNRVEFTRYWMLLLEVNIFTIFLDHMVKYYRPETFVLYPSNQFTHSRL